MRMNLCVCAREREYVKFKQMEREVCGMRACTGVCGCD